MRLIIFLFFLPVLFADTKVEVNRGKKDFSYWFVEAISQSQQQKLLIKMLSSKDLKYHALKKLNNLESITSLVDIIESSKEGHDSVIWALENLADVCSQESSEFLSKRLVANFSNESLQMQKAYVEILRSLKSKNENLINFFYNVLETHKSDSIKIRILRTLSEDKSNKERLISFLKTFLRHQNSELQLRAIIAIGKVKARELYHEIMPFLQSSDEDMRFFAIDTLCLLDIEPEKLIPIFLEKIMSDESSMVKGTCIENLYQTNSQLLLKKDIFDVIVEISVDDPVMADIVIDLLETRKEIDSQNIKLLIMYFEKSLGNREKIAKLLGKINYEKLDEQTLFVIHFLIQNLSDISVDGLVESISQIGKRFPLEIKQKLIDEYEKHSDSYLEAETKKIRILDIFSLLYQEIPDVIDFIEKELYNEDDTIRVRALEIFCDIKKSNAIPILLNILEHDASSYVQTIAIERLSILAQKTDLMNIAKILIRTFLASDRDEVKISVLSTIKKLKIHNQETLAFLVNELKKYDNEDMNIEIVKIFSDISDISIFEGLIDNFKK